MRGLRSRVDPTAPSHALAYADEDLEVVVGLKGAAPPDARLILEALDLAGRFAGERVISMRPGRHAVASFPRPVTLRLGIDLAGGPAPGKLWVRLEPLTTTDHDDASSTLLFDPAHYAAQIDGPAPDDPLAHYLTQGEAAGLTPHPWFDPGAYRDAYMTPTGREGPALLDYAARAAREPVRPHPLFDAEWRRRAPGASPDIAPLDDFLSRGDQAPNLAAAASGEIGSGSPVFAERLEGLKPVRISYHAPHLVEDAEAVARLTPMPDLPIVIIAEASDEAEAAHVRDVVSRQTHPRATLTLVDTSQDRAGRLNAALDAAGRAAVVFLDRASEWRPDHLALMAASLGRGEASIVSAAWKRIEPTGRERWLGQPQESEAYVWQDFLPLSALLHHPLQARFDPEAGAAMDWAYVRALIAEAGEPTWLPAVTLERRQPAEPARDARLALINRDLSAWNSPPSDERAASLILPIQGRFTLAQDTLAALIAAEAGADHEIILVDNGMAERDLPLAVEWTRRFDHLRLVRTPQPLRAAIGANWGGLAAHGRALVFIWAGLRPSTGWLRPLLAGLESAACVQPRLLSPDGALRSAGLAREARGSAVAPTEEMLAVDARAFRAIRGFDPLMADGAMAADLALRLADHGGFGLVDGPAQAIATERALSLAVNPEAEAAFRARWGPLAPTAPPPRPSARGAARTGEPLRIALKVCFANEPETNSGDWHFARSLAEALRTEGCRVRIDGALDWYAATEPDDVVLALRGRWRYAPSPRHLNLLWLISHPDQVGAREALAYDHVFAASPILTARLATSAASLATERRGLVSALLQCVDDRLFHPPEHRPEDRALVFVGNSRGVERPIVQAAVHERLPLEIHGRQWDRFDAHVLVRGPGLANARVADLYRHAVVLNDHWADMRASGILSNRLFDAAACGAPVISDAVAGLDEVFHGLVAAWRPGQPLAPLVRTAACEDEAWRARRLDLAQEVTKVHSFGARAREIIAVARRELARLAGDPTRRDAAPETSERPSS